MFKMIYGEQMVRLASKLVHYSVVILAITSLMAMTTLAHVPYAFSQVDRFSLQLDSRTDSSSCSLANSARLVGIEKIDILTFEHSIIVRLALVDAPEEGEPGFNKVRDLAISTCRPGTIVCLNIDDKQPKNPDGSQTAEVVCNGVSLNQKLAENDHVTFLTESCDKSKFSTAPWATKCNESIDPNLTPKPEETTLDSFNQYMILVISAVIGIVAYVVVRHARKPTKNTKSVHEQDRDAETKKYGVLRNTNNSTKTETSKDKIRDAPSDDPPTQSSNIVLIDRTATGSQYEYVHGKDIVPKNWNGKPHTYPKYTLGEDKSALCPPTITDKSSKYKKPKGVLPTDMPPKGALPTDMSPKRSPPTDTLSPNPSSSYEKSADSESKIFVDTNIFSEYFEVDKRDHEHYHENLVDFLELRLAKNEILITEKINDEFNKVLRKKIVNIKKRNTILSDFKNLNIEIIPDAETRSDWRRTVRNMYQDIWEDSSKKEQREKWSMRKSGIKHDVGQKWQSLSHKERKKIYDKSSKKVDSFPQSADITILSTLYKYKNSSEHVYFLSEDGDFTFFKKEIKDKLKIIVLNAADFYYSRNLKMD